MALFPSNKSVESNSIRPVPGWGMISVSLITIILMHLPLVVVVYESFVSSHGTSLEFGFDAYRKVFSNQDLIRALVLSFLLALSTSFGSTILGTMGALALQWGKDFPGRSLLNSMSMMPLVMPELVLGISLLICFVISGLELGFFSLLIAHISFTLSYTIVTVRSSLENFDTSMEEAGFDLGARPSQIFWKIVFPMILPAILSAMLMAFTLSFDDFMVSFFTTGVGTDPLPLKLYSMIKLGINPEVCALSTLVLAVTLALLALTRTIQKS